jgi:anti-sigma regulatory factor (Ser/Thr protein kinase)
MKQLCYELEPGPTAPAAARHAVSRDLAEVADTEALSSLKLVVSELVTNSVVHGPGKPIRLSLEVDEDGRVRGEVEDEGDGVIEIREAADGPGGRGLRIVEALTSRWGVYEGSTHVWFELSTPAS